MAEDFFIKESIFLVVGASNNEEKYGYKVFKDLKDAEYNVIGINNRVGGQEELQGTPSYKTITAFMHKISALFDKVRIQTAIKNCVVVLIVPPEQTLAVVREAHGFGISQVWFQPGSQNEEALEFCKKHKMQTIHDECIMISRPK